MKHFPTLKKWLATSLGLAAGKEEANKATSHRAELQTTVPWVTVSLACLCHTLPLCVSFKMFLFLFPRVGVLLEYLCTACLQYLQGPQEGIGSPGNGVKD